MSALTPLEHDRLAELEAVINRGLTGFLKAGQALEEVRDSRLYRLTHDTFENYCQERWGFSDSRARQLIGAAQTVTNVTVAGLPAPTNEGQARELARVPEQDRAEVWGRVVRETDGNPTAAAVRRIHEESAPLAQQPIRPTAPRKSPVSTTKTISAALGDIDRGRRALARLDVSRLTQQDEETRRMWAAGLSEHLEALERFRDTLLKGQQP